MLTAMAEPRQAAKPAPRGAPGLPPVQTPILVMVVFAIFVMLAAATRLDWTVTTRFEPLEAARDYTPTPIPMPSMAGPGQQPEVTTLPWAAPLFWIVVSVIGAILAVLLARWLWRIRPRRRVELVDREPDGAAGIVLVEQAAALQRAADDALDLLDGITEPRDAVVRSWLALEQAALADGASRRPADSPTEFVRGLLAATGADRDAVATLLGLYHRARFSEHPVGLEEIRQARTCVAGLSRSLAGYERALRAGVRSGSARATDSAGDSRRGERG